MSEQQRNDRKEEKGNDWENWWREWWPPDRVDAVGLGVYFIWGALVVLAERSRFTTKFSSWGPWAIFFVGVGIITLFETVFRLLTLEYRRGWIASFIWSLKMLAIGFCLGNWESLGWFWALILAAIGTIILLSALAPRG